MMDATIHIVPHMHYDAVWILNKEDYYFVNIEYILKQALNLIRKSDYKFMLEQTFLLEKIEKDYPHIFSEIIDCIKENKIEIAGGQYLLADNMIPNGEVLIREITEGKKFVKEKLNQDIVVSYGADEFGFNAQWPQILKNCGYKYFIFRRGIHTSTPSEFFWEGIDGSRILTHWMPLGYRAGLFLDQLTLSLKQLKKYASTNQILMLSGSGSTPPQPELVDVINEWNKKINGKKEKSKNQYKMIMSSPLQYFNYLEKQNIRFKIRKGEMYSGKFSAVYPDCTSTRMWLKQGMKEFENSILLLERLDAIAWLINIHDENISDQLQKYWKKILFVAMHDVLPGTGVDEIYNEVRELFENERKSIGRSIFDYLKKISSMTNFDDDIIFIFNPLSWKVTNWIEIILEFNEGEIKGISYLKSGDQIIDIEILDYSLYHDNSLQKINLGCVISVPALGFKTLEIVKSETIDGQTIIAYDTSFKNKEYEIEVNRENAIITVFKSIKNNKKLQYCIGNEIILDEEIGDLYYHRENLKLLKSETGDGIKYGIFKPEKYEVIHGKLKSHIKFKSKYFALRWPYRFTEKFKPMMYRHNFIDIEKEIIIYKNLNRIDFVTHIYNKHPHSRLRVKFETLGRAKSYWCGTQFGAVERKSDLYYQKDSGKWFERPSGVFPSFEWIDYTVKNNLNKTVGISLLHQGLPSHEIRNGSLYLTLLRSIVLLSSDGIMGPCIPTPDAAEMRPYTFRYSILPHENDWREDLVYQHGSEINMPLISTQIKKSNKIKKNNVSDNNSNKIKSLVDFQSFLEISESNVILSTMKLSDDKKGIILRVYETEGKKTITKIKLAAKIKNVKLVDFLENEIHEIKRIEYDTITIEINPFKIITLKIFIKKNYENKNNLNI
ncbi:MAG TPA: glycosyl hydrolase-related protein [Nitrososphaeraceae archaeon]|nr:glycosyl hydrolase-related protein [Nitrososphaeraceae archaeon]